MPSSLDDLVRAWRERAESAREDKLDIVEQMRHISFDGGGRLEAIKAKERFEERHKLFLQAATELETALKGQDAS